MRSTLDHLRARSLAGVIAAVLLVAADDADEPTGDSLELEEARTATLKGIAEPVRLAACPAQLSWATPDARARGRARTTVDDASRGGTGRGERI